MMTARRAIAAGNDARSGCARRLAFLVVAASRPSKQKSKSVCQRNGSSPTNALCRSPDFWTTVARNSEQIVAEGFEVAVVMRERSLRCRVAHAVGVVLVEVPPSANWRDRLPVAHLERRGWPCARRSRDSGSAAGSASRHASIRARSVSCSEFAAASEQARQRRVSQSSSDSCMLGSTIAGRATSAAVAGARRRAPGQTLRTLRLVTYGCGS